MLRRVRIKNVIQNNKKYFKYILLAVLIYFPVFNHLDVMAIRLWDEARLAINAVNMMNNGNYLVTYFDGKPDMWNTKPPMMIWMQVGFMKLIGINEIAIRLPSAFAAFFTSVTILVFSKRYLKSFWFGFIAILVLITSFGFINLHTSRTGDYDALLTLFTTISSLMVFAFIESKKKKYIYLFFISLAFGVLTKSIVGLLFLPGLFIYILIFRQFIPLLKNIHFYFGILIFIILVLGYYFLREIYNPGYIEAVLKNEVGGRYLKVVENHTENVWFYLNNFMNFKFDYWFVLVPFGIVTGLVQKDQKIKRLVIFSIILTVSFLVIISSSQTKLEWYDLPIYPFLSIIVTVFIFTIFKFLNRNEFLNKKLVFNILPFIFLIFIFLKPYQDIFNKTYKPVEYSYDEEYYKLTYYLKNQLKKENTLNGEFLLYKKYSPHILFYLYMIKEKGIDLLFKDYKKLEINDVVLTQDVEIKKYVEKNYIVKGLYNYDDVSKYQILGFKK